MSHKISVGFSRGIKPSWIGKAIMKVIGTPYSHTYIHLKGSRRVFEADFGGVEVLAFDKWDDENFVIDDIEIIMSDERYEELLQFIADNKGKPYGLIQLFKILKKKLGLPTWMKNGSRLYICSELVARALAPELGLDPKSDLDLITPRDVHEMVKELK